MMRGAAVALAMVTIVAARSAGQQPVPPNRFAANADVAATVTTLHPDSAKAGQRFDITVEVTNNGPQPVGAIELTLEPTLLVIRNVTASGHTLSCKKGASQAKVPPITCEFTGTLNVHAHVDIVVTTTVSGKSGEFAKLSATVKGAANDPAPANNKVERYFSISN